MDGQQYGRQMEIIKLQRQVVVHATVVFYMYSDGPSTQLLENRFLSKFFLGEPQFHWQLEVCIQ